MGGYEVKSEGDSFFVAFEDPMQAARWCLAVQTELLTLDWPAPGGTMLPPAGPQLPVTGRP